MSSKPIFEIAYADSESKQIAKITGFDVEQQLKKMKESIEHMLANMQKIGQYELAAFTAHVGGKLGVLVFEANGFIEMKWEKAKK